MRWSLPDREIVFASRPLIMGIVNVTPDSFSDGGRFADPQSAVVHGCELVEQGADILDVGGESTRPGAVVVPREEELARTVPVVQELAKEVTVPISIDTSKASVAKACLQAGAAIINDVTALTGDPNMPGLAKDSGAGVILMHMQGTPPTMQDDPTYDDVVREVKNYLAERIAELTAFGLEKDRLAIDPGIGFGKRDRHSLELLSRLEEFQQLGRPVCLGVSRKGFIGKICDRSIEQRAVGSAAVACFAMSKNAVQILRVHDVAETRDAVRMWAALSEKR